MTSPHSPSKNLTDLLDRLAEGRLEGNDIKRLRDILVSDPQACMRYIEAMHLQAGIVQWVDEYEGSLEDFVKQGVDLKESELLRSLQGQDDLKAPVEDQAAPGKAAATHSSQRKSTSRWITPLALAASVAIAVAGFQWFNQPPSDIAESPDSIAGEKEENVANLDDLFDPDDEQIEPGVIGRIVRLSADATWNKETSPNDPLWRILAGDRYSLETGLAEIEFTSGVRMILHPRTDFTFRSPVGGFLHMGSVTGIAEKGIFNVTTESARVIDLGTEFGVTHDESHSTEVAVFQGEVQVIGTNLVGPIRSIKLVQGESAHIASDGELAVPFDADQEKYVRTFPQDLRKQETPDRISLVDILCGGEGLCRSEGYSNRLSAAIDPLTGSTDRRPPPKKSIFHEQQSDGLFHRADHHPAIDGVFIVPADGYAVPLTSEGHAAHGLGKNDGESYGPIWASRPTNRRASNRSEFIWGSGSYRVVFDRLSKSNDGGIGIHPNAGITFDLNAIRDTRSRPLESFQTTVCNLDYVRSPKVLEKRPVRTADFWVFVDGELRGSRRNFGRDRTGLLLEVALSQEDRFLTLITTDAGNTNECDHVLLVDPVVKLQSRNQDNLSD